MLIQNAEVNSRIKSAKPSTKVEVESRVITPKDRETLAKPTQPAKDKRSAELKAFDKLNKAG